MARTAIVPIALTRNGAAALTYTAVAAADDAVITVPEGERCVIIVVGHATNAATITVVAGTGEQSWMRAAGDVSFALPATETRVFGPFDSAQFENADGTLYLDTDQPVTIAALRLP